ncbi:MAG: carboxypeptidase regulatory-like domain-containing protein [Brumimicrobium sp.]|nr:carboxypeptidase regulatory-like domain-containing protein [Brumimicrobium sp.]MCO5268570.1 DUF5686 family protein [Brumimicrobium sp.]
MSKFLLRYCSIFLLLLPSFVWSQYEVKGRITDESNIGIPYAEVFVKNKPELRTRSDINGNYLMRLEVGEYYLVFSAVGFEDREYYLGVKEKQTLLDMQLFSSKVEEFESVDYRTKRRNVGRDIVLRTVKIKDEIDFNKYAYSTQVYIRATKEKKVEGTKKQEKEKIENAHFDSVEELKRKKLSQLQDMDMVEVELTRNYVPPASIKEVRNAYTKRGNDQYLYFTTTAAANFNFFQNILYLNDLSKNPIQSPISNAGILSYKYQLVEKIERKDQPSLNKIKITPRNVATSTLDGYIWIADSSWMVEKLEFTISKGNLFIYDYFTIQQEFRTVGDTMSVLTGQIMKYGVSFNKEKYDGITNVSYTNYNFSPNFKGIKFGNEVAVTTTDAYDKDTSYWSQNRLIPLTLEEQKYIKQRDSIENMFLKQNYLDSIDSVFNKVTFWKVVWFGIDHRNRAKKTQWTISSIAGTMRPLYIAGPRIGPDFSFYKKWNNERSIDYFIRTDVGVLNGDVKGWTTIQYLYDPFRQSNLWMNVSHNYDLIRSYDALTQVFLRDNFIVSTSGTLGHTFEAFNGFVVETELTYIYRSPLPANTKFIRWFDKALNNVEPPVFTPFNSFIGNLMIRYTPFQKYMREPKRKVILGSKWPTIYMSYEKGIPKIFDSDVNHDYIQFGMSQAFNIGTWGTSQYHITTGKFLNTKKLHPEDFKFFRRGDPILFSNPLYSYQDLDSTLPTMNWYLETHYIHHFNGALINKIPFMKKTRISTVAGGGFLWVPEHDWIHYELYVGLERIFKFAKRRLRIGAYCVFSEGNHISKLKTSFKISFAILDERSMKFTF